MTLILVLAIQQPCVTINVTSYIYINITYGRHAHMWKIYHPVDAVSLVEGGAGSKY